MTVIHDDASSLLVRNSALLLKQPCVRPLQQKAERVDLSTGELSAETWQIPCGSRWESVCPSCAARKARDTWLVATSGLMPLKILGDEQGVIPAPAQTEHVLFVTLTAPSFGRIHRVNGCPCKKKHHEKDELVGCPIDWRKYRFREQAVWNAMSSRLFSRTIDRFKRNHPGDLEYFGVVEFQKRQAVHFHILLKSSVRFQIHELLSHLRDVHIFSGAGKSGQEVRWGAEADIQDFDPEERQHLAALEDSGAQHMGKLHYALKAVRYLHKDYAYTGKNSTLSKRLARFADRLERIGDRVRNSGELAGLKPLKRMPLGGGAGFTGQRVKKSRGWGLLTYAILAQKRKDFRVSANSDKYEVWKIGAPYSLDLDQVQERRDRPDAMVDSLRVLSARVATEARGDPPALELVA